MATKFHQHLSIATLILWAATEVLLASLAHCFPTLSISSTDVFPHTHPPNHTHVGLSLTTGPIDIFQLMSTNTSERVRRQADRKCLLNHEHQVVLGIVNSEVVAVASVNDSVVTSVQVVNGGPDVVRIKFANNYYLARDDNKISARYHEEPPSGFSSDDTTLWCEASSSVYQLYTPYIVGEGSCNSARHLAVKSTDGQYRVGFNQQRPNTRFLYDASACRT